MTDFGPDGFTAQDIPDLTGKTYAITGANSGIGLEAARHMGRAGAKILMLCRSMDKAGQAADDLRATAPAGQYDIIPLDLARMESVRGAAMAINGTCDGLDGIINNAGLMLIPKRNLTEDGHEMHFGVNFLGHFALNGLLAQQVERSGGRIVSVSSIAHHYAKEIPFDDLTQAEDYGAMKSYSISKLANLVYGFELARRLSATGSSVKSVACHPGWSATNLQSTAPSKLIGLVMKPLNAIFAQSPELGSLPTVLAATSYDAESGGYYGPSGGRQFKGPVREVPAKPWAMDPQRGEKLWQAAVEATGVDWLTTG